MKRKLFPEVIIGLLIAVLLGGIFFVSRVNSQEQLDDVAVDVYEKQAVQETIPILFNYQGRLLNADGQPVNENAVPMTFEIYNQASGGSSCWSESHTDVNAVEVEDGIFQVTLGQLSDIPATCASGIAYLQLTIDDEVLEPRELLTAVATAVESLTLPDGAKISSLVMYGDLEAGPGNYHYYITNDHGSLRTSSVSSIHHFIDSDNNSTDNATFTVWGDNKVLDNPFKLLFSVRESGDATIGRNLEVRGNMDLQGSCVANVAQAWEQGAVADSSNCQGGSLTAGAIIEANLQTPKERNLDKNIRFSQGDLLCWEPDQQQLELCATENDRLVMAVADRNGKPIVIGAEPVRVVGPITAGDILVSSAEPGHAVVNNDPTPGTVIGQALDDMDGESGLIKAMIRKW